MGERALRVGRLHGAGREPPVRAPKHCNLHSPPGWDLPAGLEHKGLTGERPPGGAAGRDPAPGAAAGVGRERPLH